MEKKEFVGAGENINRQKRVPDYEPPEIITYTGEEILEQIGPAQACSPNPCATTG